MRLWDLGAQQSCDRCGSAFVLSYPPFVCPVLQSVLAILLTTLLLYYLLLTTYYLLHLSLFCPIPPKC